ITLMEVNTARTYNWDVKRQRERRLCGKALAIVDRSYGHLGSEPSTSTMHMSNLVSLSSKRAV
ncbi:hypothetical protein K439DRAFT_1345682, partial [Ramaria rubella]